MKRFGGIWLAIGLISIGLGLCLLFVGAMIGLPFKDGATFSYEETYDNVHSLDFDINYGKIRIIDGSSFRIDAYNLHEGSDFSSKVIDGVWTIEESSSKNNIFHGIPISGISISKENKGPEIVITIPKEFEAKNIQISLGAGLLQADTIRSIDGSFEVGAGKMHISYLEITERSDYEVGVGSIVIDNMTASNIDAECSLGNLVMNGRITGNNNIQSGVGQILMELVGDKEKYYFDFNSGVGNVIMNGKGHQDVTMGHKSKSNLDGSFHLDNGIGNITLNIYE